MVSVGSECYALSQFNTPSSSMWIRNTKKRYLWQKAPNMTVAREKPIARVLDGKIYVMGGCTTGEYTNWGEVFDPKTQTWEPLPDPGPELRFSTIRKLDVIQGKLYVRSNEEKDSVYDPKEGKWDVAEKPQLNCKIDDVWYYCDKQNCVWWYDTKLKKWRVVGGLALLNRNLGSGTIEVANYNGKLIILWDKMVHPDPCQYKDIWCAVISLERRVGTDELWGNVEWVNTVVTVPSSFVFLHSQQSKV